MKVIGWSVFFCAALRLAQAARKRIVRSENALDTINSNADANSNADTSSSALQVALKSMVAEMMESDGKGPSSRDILSTAESKMDLGDAVRQLDGKLPSDVAALVRVTQDKSGSKQYDEASLEKARNILNGMMLKGWRELDEVIFECMGFRQRNRGTYTQVVADLCRLGSQIARLNEIKVKAGEGKTEQDRARKEAEQSLETRTSEFKSRRIENENEMTERKNDLAVFDFVLNLTSCRHIEGTGVALVQDQHTQPQMKICDTAEGFDLHFDNPQLQARVERMMTKDARMALRAALGQTVRQSSLFQVADAKILPTVNTTTAFPVQAVDPLPVSEDPQPESQWKKCVDGKANCGLLHDLMSLEWGKFRDSFDELTKEMNENTEAFDEFESNINDQLTVINNEETKHMESLAAATSSYNADVEEMGNKEEQKEQLTEEFDRKCAEFKAKITEILHTKICAVRKVRNELMTYSKITPPDAISDCDFTDWQSESGECHGDDGKVITCDDSCNVNVPYDEYNPYECGGTEAMKRDVVVAANQYGMACPQDLLERKRRCKQKLCKVNCEISVWSGWSKCSKDCESGVESRTRSILVKPKNGGTICDATQECQPCNTGSCDRDCTLYDWTEWSPCSMACNTGFTTRKRGVLVPIRGQGKCPVPDSVDRWEEENCNTHKCIGDERCIAKQDLIIALDSSGSLRESGFEILRNFAMNLTKKYEPVYFGQQTMRIGLVLFGNGKLVTQSDGSNIVSPAIEVSPLTDNFEELRSQMAALTWQRGFTNMAQALTLADVLLSRKGRTEAQSAILVLTDGKYSFKFQTQERATELKDKNIQIYMAPVTDFEDTELGALKEWASQPWQTNYERIPGLAALEHNAEIFIQLLLVKFCPDALSLSLLKEKEEEVNYMMIHERGRPSWSCSESYSLGKANTPDDCAALAIQARVAAFSYGQGRSAEGSCWAEPMQVTQADYDTWCDEREFPLCKGGEWENDRYHDTYAIKPSVLQLA